MNDKRCMWLLQKIFYAHIKSNSDPSNAIRIGKKHEIKDEIKKNIYIYNKKDIGQNEIKLENIYCTCFAVGIIATHAH